jgi:hypothetical protein
MHGTMNLKKIPDILEIIRKPGSATCQSVIIAP